MKKSKKLLMTLSLFSLVSTLSGCSKNSNPSTTSSITNSTTSSTSSVEPEVTPTFKYTVNDSNEITITSINDDTVTDLVIPDEIDGKKVVTVNIKGISGSSIKSIKFGKNISNFTFDSGLDFSNVEKIEVDENNETLVSKNNCVFSRSLDSDGNRSLYLGCKTSIIPDKTNEGYEQIYITRLAFWPSKIESIHIPDSVNYIGNEIIIPKFLKVLTVDPKNSRFNDAGGKNVLVSTNDKQLLVTNQTGYIPDDASICTTIRKNVFERVPVETITIPDNITGIQGTYNFWNCPNLTTIKLGSGLTTLTINVGSFYGSTKLKNIDVSNNKYFKFENGILSRYVETKETYTDSDKLVAYFYFGDSDTFTLDDKYSQIGQYAFHNNKTIKNVVLPSVSNFTINTYAFYGSSLENINLENCSSWNNYSFANCKNLKTIKVGTELNYSDTNVFKDSIIEKVILPQNILLGYSGSGALYNCLVKDLEFYLGTATSERYTKDGNQILDENGTKLCFIIGDEKNIIVNENVAQIDNLKLYNRNYTSVIFPQNLTQIGNLNGATGIKKFDMPTLKVIRNGGFMQTDLEEIILYEGMNSIQNRSFYGSKLKSLTIPKSVNYLGTYLLSYTPCTYLELKNKSLVFKTDTLGSSNVVKTFKYHGTMIDFKKSFTTKEIFDKNFPKLEKLQLLDTDGTTFIDVLPSELTW